MTRRLTVDLEGRCALVTGGGTGIGRAISLGLARCGARVVVNYSRSVREAEATVAEITRPRGAGPGRSRRRHRRGSGQAGHRSGGPDLWRAGHPDGKCRGPYRALLHRGPVQPGLGCGIEPELQVGLPVHQARRAPPAGRPRGRILITSSISARSGGGPGTITYTAAKGALNNLVRGWAKEFAPRGITVNAISPGVIWTRIHQQRTPPEVYRGLIKRIPLGRDGQPEDCVGAALFLASADASYITGQILEVNGGMLMP